MCFFIFINNTGKWPWQVGTDIIKNPQEVFIYFINHPGKWPWQEGTDSIRSPQEAFLYFIHNPGNWYRQVLILLGSPGGISLFNLSPWQVNLFLTDYSTGSYYFQSRPLPTSHQTTSSVYFFIIHLAILETHTARTLEFTKLYVNIREVGKVLLSIFYGFSCT